MEMNLPPTTTYRNLKKYILFLSFWGTLVLIFAPLWSVSLHAHQKYCVLYVWVTVSWACRVHSPTICCLKKDMSLFGKKNAWQLNSCNTPTNNIYSTLRCKNDNWTGPVESPSQCSCQVLTLFTGNETHMEQNTTFLVCVQANNYWIGSQRPKH